MRNSLRFGAILLAACGCASGTVSTPRPLSAPAARIRATIEKLVSFGTRHTLSATEGPRGIGAAREWVRGEFESIAAASGRTGDEAMRVRFDRHVQPPAERIPREVEIVNVEAVLPGSRPDSAARRYYFVAHLDSRASDPLDATSDAPGANDDGSGVAALLEAARELSKMRLDATVVFLAVSGEEQGLFGSRLHAKAAKAAGDDIRAVLSNDIVGDPSNPGGPPERGAIRVFSEGMPRGASPEEQKRVASLGAESDSPSRQLARYVAEVAEFIDSSVTPRLVFRTDRFLRGGDHIPFLEQGVPAVRFTDVVEKYDRQHQDVRTEGDRRFGDLAEFVDAEYLADVALLDAAVLLHLANAPSSPGDVRVITKELTNGTTLRWSRAPEGDVAGYEVVWRATTSPTWDHVFDAGDVAESTVSLSKDDYLFGVRSYDGAGYRSPVAFPAAAKE